jgi:hypothetical protein
MRHDKHANAYDVLLNERSKTIAQNLAAAAGAMTEAHQDARCLACHAIPAANYADLEGQNRLKDGVSCESCHGAAGNWLVEHTTESWRRRTPREKQELGMPNTKDLAARAQMCAGCHVGAPANAARGEPVRDAYHDIMAAGHPRLNFELGSYSATMPKHWVEQNVTPDFEVRVWAIGQIATAHAALRLLESRASSAKAGKAPWPEFAEYDCFACHHDLKEPSWRQDRRYAARKPGALPWGTWFLPMTRVLATRSGHHDLLKELERIEQLMSTPSADGAHPSLKEAASRANSAAKSLSEVLRKLANEVFDSTTSRELASLCVGESETLVKSGWDAAAQLYLALVALNQTLKDDQLTAALDLMVKKLEFPPQYDSPKSYRKNFAPTNPDAFQRELETIQQRVGN